MHGKPPPGNIQKLYRFENPRNELIVACLSGPAYEQKMAADSRDVPLWDVISAKTVSEDLSGCMSPIARLLTLYQEPWRQQPSVSALPSNLWGILNY